MEWNNSVRSFVNICNNLTGRTKINKYKQQISQIIKKI